MGGVEYFVWLAIHAFEGMVLFPPAGLLAVGGVIGACLTIAKIPPGRWRQALAAALLPSPLPIGIVLCGVVFVCDEAPPLARWPEALINLLLLIHIPLAIALCKYLRDVRWFSLSVSCAVFGYSIGAAVLSTMSVSGTWL